MSNDSFAYMVFTGQEDQVISLQDAAVLTRSYRDAQPAAAFFIKAEYFSQESLRRVLDQEGCVGIRAYYGKDDEGHSKLVIVGALSDGDDMVDGIILDKSIACPYVCSSANDLNS